MYYAEEFRDGQWWHRGTPKGEWRRGRLEGFSASMERERMADTYEVAPLRAALEAVAAMDAAWDRMRANPLSDEIAKDYRAKLDDAQKFAVEAIRAAAEPGVVDALCHEVDDVLGDLAELIDLLQSRADIDDEGGPNEAMRMDATVSAAHELIRNLSAAALATPQLPAARDEGWLPIESAPRDGTQVLLVNRKGNIATGLWQGVDPYAGWWLRGGNKPNTFFNGHHGPTHWQPLPSPPDAAQAEAGKEG